MREKSSLLILSLLYLVRELERNFIFFSPKFFVIDLFFVVVSKTTPIHTTLIHLISTFLSCTIFYRKKNHGHNIIKQYVQPLLKVDSWQGRVNETFLCCRGRARRARVHIKLGFNMRNIFRFFCLLRKHAAL
jgi:hypothetical protein